EAFLRLVSDGKVKIEPLITHRFPIDRATEAYDLITGKTGEAFTGVVLTYSPDAQPEMKISPITAPASSAQLARVRVGVLGAGNFANNTLLPLIKASADVDLICIASGRGVSARSSADKFGFRYCATDAGNIFADPDINAVVILTRHDLHARQTIA